MADRLRDKAARLYAQGKSVAQVKLAERLQKR
jgi:hypothetical protein